MNIFRSVLLLVLLQPTFLLASGHGDPIKIFIWQWVDFGIFLFLAILANYIAGNPIKKFWESRWKTIERAVKSGDFAFSVAQKKLSQVKEKEQNVDSVIADIDKKIVAETKAEVEYLLAHAKRQANTLIEHTAIRADIERQTIEKNIKDELIEHVINDVTRRLVQANTYEKDRERRFLTISSLENWASNRRAEK